MAETYRWRWRRRICGASANRARRLDDSGGASQRAGLRRRALRGLAEEFGLGRRDHVERRLHRIELRAPDYETLTFSVMIEPNGLVRYRGDMQRIATKPAAAAVPSQPAPAPAPAKSFYVIPNCYAGDKPPSGALARKGCDIKNLQTRQIRSFCRLCVETAITRAACTRTARCRRRPRRAVCRSPRSSSALSGPRNRAAFSTASCRCARRARRSIPRHSR